MKNSKKSGIKAWADVDRPRERLLLQGRRTLTDAELIAILLGSGYKSGTAVDVGRQILHHYDHDLAKLGKAGMKELSLFKGVGTAKAATIIAALELGRRRKEQERPQHPRIVSSKDAYAILHPEMSDLAHEEFWVLLLNRAHRVMAKHVVSRGGQAMTYVDPKEVFKQALIQNAAALIVGHNHPSGNLSVSNADMMLTKRLLHTGKLLGMPLLDHLIITDHHFLSFADEGLLDACGEESPI